MRKILEHCPACDSDLMVTQLKCTECETSVSGQFTPTRFNRLSPDDLSFAEMFIRLRGNIKDMERELGVSYPTVRSRLNEVIGQLGFDAPDEIPSEADNDLVTSRRNILQQLNQGDISAIDAADRLKKLTRGND